MAKKGFDRHVAALLKHPEEAEALIAALENDAAASYDLLFHAAFADKLLGVMKRTGPTGEGFGRMQQTFGEAVEKIRSAIARAGQLGFASAENYTQLSPEAMRKLIELLHDLAIVKQAER